MIGYVLHDHYDTTSEGLGSHARGVIYPVIHVALQNGLEPVFDSPYVGNTARDYSELDIASFFGLSSPDLDNCELLEVSTWTDPVVGSAYGDAQELADLLGLYLRQRPCRTDKPLLIRLMGTLRYMNPSPVVYQWLQQRSENWQPPSRRLQIVAHVRVPEDFCPQSWKDDNHISHVLSALQDLPDDNFDLDVHTEEGFSIDDEQLLRSRYPQAHIHRGNASTLLEDLRNMASADLFIPSASHLSALAAYLSHGVVLIDPRRHGNYFHPHAQLCPERLVQVGDCGRLKKIMRPSRDPRSVMAWR